jgi:hypothetical protein
MCTGLHEVTARLRLSTATGNVSTTVVPPGVLRPDGTTMIFHDAISDGET